ncbi:MULTISPECIES: rhomboid family intramembrane serine protease [unclassified Bradyrhizobium]|uniref:rhomboid family intramembrane serine protease n=1 Tax=unclassified Bradyrhizobium TaxID=2631580 RepID=UPI0020B25609|nr:MULTISPECIES: rhomboid family intramembrane serine protease [unclassified Bradyrhizobium]MCP3381591.1 rhomboid family intramembrane serine protease [Bradyrhizobium sp. CCGUVB4N]MCP3442672.1 rhomboid family intramembrane serine protease [Bradyrhizobium sp. CCGUVB14]
MPSYRASFFEVPHAAVYALMTVTVLASGFCLIQAGGPAAPAELLYRYGGMYAGAIARHEYWRLIAYGFLHVNFVHLTMNMLCLVLWGGHLERRVGPAYFLVIYLCAMVFGAVIGNGIHSTPYLTVGASGATSGILGALLCLWILGKLDVRFDFFAINIGLNIAFALGNSRIDWGVHLGGFAAGLIACALLDLIEKVNPYALRCKFPEAVKVNLTLLACVAAVWAWSGQAQAIAAGISGWGLAVVVLVACCAIVKLVDLALSMKKGLAIVVIALAGANAVTILLCGLALASSCSPRWPTGSVPLDNLLVMVCPNPVLIAGLAAIGAAAVTLWLCAKEISRGIEDVGFVATSLRAERNRRHGL